MRWAAGAAMLVLTACGGGTGDTTGTVGYGRNPELPAPQTGGGLPTIKTADPIGWEAGAAPTAPEGFTVTRFAEGLAHPRWLHVLPNGDILVAESSSQPTQGGGIVGWIGNMVQRNAGAYRHNANRITLLRDGDGDGVAERRTVFRENLNQPFGMAYGNGEIFIANTDAVLRFPYRLGEAQLEGDPEVLVELPHNPGGNGHWTRDLLLSADGTKLYVSVGSVSNIPDSPEAFALEEGRAAIWEVDLASGAHRIYASGLRNPNGLAWEPRTQRLWAAVNERDMLGDDLVPDYMTSVRDGGFYGWPYSYFGQRIDARVSPQNPDLVARAIAPDYALGPHTASLGLAFYTAQAFPARYQGGVFVGQHGSWNRNPPSGYKVIFVPFTEGAPDGAHEDFLTGFLEDGRARGRPVGVAVDSRGGLLVADDVGDIVWRVAPAA